MLVHNGVPICESAAIQIYLGETFGGKRTVSNPPGNVARAGDHVDRLTNATWAKDVASRAGTEWAPADERNAKAGAGAEEIRGMLQILKMPRKGKST